MENETTAQSSAAPPWQAKQVYAMAVVCLLVGIAGGWLIRGSRSPAAPATQIADPSAPAGASAGTSGQTPSPTPAEMRKMADTQAAPLLEQIKADPSNAGLLENTGDIYYDTRQFPAAIEYYQRALQVQPANAGVRTKMATSYWYAGNTDTAIAEFNKSLSYEPNRANTLFILGVVEWLGKTDVDKALATWQKLLDTNPNYEGKDKVLELMAQAKKHVGVKPGAAAKPLP
jgi:cytochrome c-type biogenesis protein CcmH/NrfG